MKKESHICKCLWSVLVFALVSFGTGIGSDNAQDDSELGSNDEGTWKTTGLRLASTIGGGPAPIAKSGQFREFALMGQSSMHGAIRSRRLLYAADGVHLGPESYVKLGVLEALRKELENNGRRQNE